MNRIGREFMNVRNCDSVKGMNMRTRIPGMNLDTRLGQF